MPAFWRERHAPPLDGRCMGGEVYWQVEKSLNG